jgi:hypothetical protein
MALVGRLLSLNTSTCKPMLGSTAAVLFLLGMIVWNHHPWLCALGVLCSYLQQLYAMHQSLAALQVCPTFLLTPMLVWYQLVCH